MQRSPKRKVRESFDCQFDSAVLDRLAVSNGCTELVGWLRPSQKEASLRKRGVIETMKVLRRIEANMARLLEYEQSVDVEALRKMVLSGVGQLKGFSKGGEVVLWFAHPKNTRNLREFSVHVVHTMWCFLWATRLAELEGNGRVLVIHYDHASRSSLDFNPNLYKASFEMLAPFLMLENSKVRVLMVSQKKASRILVEIIMKLVHPEIREIFHPATAKEAADLLADQNAVPELFSGSKKEFVPSFDSVGDFPSLFDREGFASFTTAEAINWELQSVQCIELLRKSTLPTQIGDLRCQATLRSMARASPPELQLSPIIEDSCSSDTDESSDEEKSVSGMNGESLF